MIFSRRIVACRIRAKKRHSSSGFLKSLAQACICWTRSSRQGPQPCLTVNVEILHDPPYIYTHHTTIIHMVFTCVYIYVYTHVYLWPCQPNQASCTIEASARIYACRVAPWMFWQSASVFQSVVSATPKARPFNYCIVVFPRVRSINSAFKEEYTCRFSVRVTRTAGSSGLCPHRHLSSSWRSEFCRRRGSASHSNQCEGTSRDVRCLLQNLQGAAPREGALYK